MEAPTSPRPIPPGELPRRHGILIGATPITTGQLYRRTEASPRLKRNARVLRYRSAGTPFKHKAEIVKVSGTDDVLLLASNEITQQRDRSINEAVETRLNGYRLSDVTKAVKYHCRAIK